MSSLPGPGNTKAYSMDAQMAPPAETYTNARAMHGEAARPFGRAFVGLRLDSSRAPRPSHHTTRPGGAWLLADSRTFATPTLARFVGDDRCHTDIRRPQSPSLDLRTLHTWLLPRGPAKKRHHHGHGKRSTNQSPGHLPRAPDFGAIHPARHQPGLWYKSARFGRHGPIQPREKAFTI